MRNMLMQDSRDDRIRYLIQKHVIKPQQQSEVDLKFQSRNLVVLQMENNLLRCTQLLTSYWQEVK